MLFVLWHDTVLRTTAQADPTTTLACCPTLTRRWLWLVAGTDGGVVGMQPPGCTWSVVKRVKTVAWSCMDKLGFNTTGAQPQAVDSVICAPHDRFRTDRFSDLPASRASFEDS